MMKLGVTISSYQLVYDRNNLRKSLRAIGNMVAREARSLIRAGTVSKPGSPPVSRTGALAASIRVKVSRSGESVAVRDSKFYALFLEKGAKGGGGRRGTGPNRRGKPSTSRVLEARPFMSAALDASQSMIEQRLKEAITQSIRGKTQ